MGPRRAVQVGLKFAREELASPVRGHEPAMLRRGFVSAERWLYPNAHVAPQDYLSYLTISTRVYHLNSPVTISLFKNKIAFQDSLEARGLARHAPRFHATVLDGHLYARTSLDAVDGFVVKPAMGNGGRDVLVVPTPDELVARSPQWEAHVVQERILSRGWAAELSPDALPTARVLALRDPVSNEAFVAAAVLQFGTRKSGNVDNFGAGGIAARIDVDTGELSAAVGMPNSAQRQVFSHHPERGGQIEGRRIPGWSEVVRLTEALMAGFPEAIHIGWDIHPGPDGPVLIEGNTSPNVNIFQAHGPLLTDPRIHRFYRHHGVLRG